MTATFPRNLPIVHSLCSHLGRASSSLDIFLVVLPIKRRLPFIRSALPIDRLLLSVDAVSRCLERGCQPMHFGGVETGLRDRPHVLNCLSKLRTASLERRLAFNRYIRSIG